MKHRLFLSLNFILIPCILFVVTEVSAGSEGQLASAVDDVFNILDNMPTEGRLLSIEQETLIQSNSDNVDRIIATADEALSLVYKIGDLCDEVERLFSLTSWKPCMDGYQLIGGLSAEMKLKAGRYCVKKGLKNRARSIFRELIITYTGDSYKSYVRAAEFELEDLKNE